MTDLNINIKAPAIEKLVDYVASGVGAIAGPMLAPWRASREGEAKIISARKDAEAHIIQAESECESLKIIAKAQSEAKELYIGAQNEESLRTVQISRSDITQCIEFQKRKRLANIKKVVDEAADILADKKVADHEPDPDWTARFFNSVQDISSEDMQKIWGKILAGEVERPGKTSLRTMDILRNMTKKDAELFKKISAFVLGNGFIFYERVSTNSYMNMNYDNILHLQNCGLINAGSLLESKILWENRTKITFKYQKNLLEVPKKPNSTEEALNIPALWLTEAGEELFSVVHNSATEQIEYLQDFSRFLKSKDYELFLIKFIETSPDGVPSPPKRIKIEPKSEQLRNPET